MKTVRLVDQDGVLALESGRMLFYHYIEGDVNCIAWPLREHEQHAMLLSAVFDERERGRIGADVDTIELPDGTLMLIDEC